MGLRLLETIALVTALRAGIIYNGKIYVITTHVCSQLYIQWLWYIHMSIAYRNDAWYVGKLSLIAGQHVAITFNWDNCRVFYIATVHNMTFTTQFHVTNWCKWHTGEFLNILPQHWKTIQVLYTQYICRTISTVPNQHCTSALMAMWPALNVLVANYIAVLNLYHDNKMIVNKK